MPTIPVVPTIVGVPNSVAESVLNPNEVKPPASGTRKARVLYDYEAADSTELALLADEVGSFSLLSIACSARSWLLFLPLKPPFYGTANRDFSLTLVPAELQ